MTLQQLRCTMTTVDCDSISDAAEQLFVTQPSLSNAIKGLEKEMSISTFDRSSKGTVLSSQGVEFPSYARQMLEQTGLLGQHYTNEEPVERICSISIQHYTLAVSVFTDLVSRQSTDECKFTLRETRTYETIDGVKDYKNELGILYINDFNWKALEKLFKESGLVLHPLLRVSPHVFISVSHPLSARRHVTIEDLRDYPLLAFEQDEKNSFYFLEEVLSTIPRKKVIYISDKATLFSLLTGLNGYIICNSTLNRNLNGDLVMAIPLGAKDNTLVGQVVDPRIRLSQFVRRYLEGLNRPIGGQS